MNNLISRFFIIYLVAIIFSSISLAAVKPVVEVMNKKEASIYCDKFAYEKSEKSGKSQDEEEWGTIFNDCMQEYGFHVEE